jgi:hypothetical protein
VVFVVSTDLWRRRLQRKQLSETIRDEISQVKEVKASP